jgi:hypothetical protein
MKMKFVHHFVSLSRSLDRFVFISLQNAIEMTFSFFFFLLTIQQAYLELNA